MATSWSLRAVLASAAIAVVAAQTELPVVDLGYQLQRASAYSDEGQFYNFSNIRYAAPPTGNLRWRPPQHPDENRDQVDDGLTERLCPQGSPGWQSASADFIVAYLTGQPYNASGLNTTFVPAPQDPRESEDCLFLDVFAPKEVFENAGKGYGVPVLVWIYGGGYTLGGKAGSGSPAGLLDRSFEPPTTGGIIYVAMNYRLGAFGFSAGPSLQEDGVANAGLLDQRFALEWVQEHIEKFGGDPKKVTVFGESAGGGSIMHQITAYGGAKGSVPFQQAVPQSPGWFPLTSPALQETNFQDFLRYANLSSLEDARSASTEVLMNANIQQIGRDPPYGQFVYTPTIDGSFVPALPGQSLLYGNFDKNVRVMVGHNANEGLLFTSPALTTSTAVAEFMKQSFPFANPQTLEYIASLYPDDFETQGLLLPYKDQVGRAAYMISEFIFTCNTNYLDRAYNNETYAYYFTVPPALHGQDISYTYYVGNETLPEDQGASPLAVQNATVAIALQEFITSFAQTGRPVGGEGIPLFKMYGEDAGVMEISGENIGRIRDPAANDRCKWWQKGLYY